MSVLASTSATFNQDVLSVKDMPVLVDFWAPWCGPCRMQGPVVDELAEEMSGQAKFVKVDVDDNGDLAAQYGIMSIPALKIFKNGEVVEEMVGLHDKRQLKEVLARHQ